MRSHCLRGWLGPDPDRWDVITFNFGLHDLASPDNEHVSTAAYSKFLAQMVLELQTSTRAHLWWVTTTPVPTAPPAECVLLPGRVESQVSRNASWKTSMSG